MFTVIILDLFEGIDYEIVKSPEYCSFILAANIDSVVIDIHSH